MTPRPWAVCATILAAAAVAQLICPAARAQTAAEKRLDAMAERLANAEAIRTAFAMTYSITVNGRTETMSNRVELDFQRPERVRVQMEGDDDAVVLLLFDGESLTTYITEYEAYTVQPGAQNAAHIIAKTGFGPFGSITQFLAGITQSEPFAGLRSEEFSITSAGTEAIDGEDCYRLRIERHDEAWDVWIPLAGDPVIRRIVPDMSAQVEQLRGKGMMASVEVDCVFSEWSFAALPEERFAFAPPAGTEQVVSFREKQLARMQASGDLAGRKAPPFTLKLLDGETLDLAALKGQYIVILDFWATWCGPCRQAMPILEEIAKRFADRSVRLYAINVQEDERTVRRFLKKHGLNLAVALDTNGAVSKRYGVTGIPTTVVVGKDGRVQAVHRGFSPALKSDLTKQLTALAEGESLID